MKTIIGLFDNYSEAQAVVRDLERAGYDRTNLSVIANEKARGGVPRSSAAIASSDDDTSAAEGAASGAVIGGVTGGVAGLLAGLAGLAVPGIGPVLAAGPIVAALTGGGIGAVAGGLIGALVSAGVPEEHARYYEEGIRRGGTLVTVAAGDDRADEAMGIMNRHKPVDIEERAALWREQTVGKTISAGTGADSDPFDAGFRTNFQQTFRGNDYTFDQVKPVYRFGQSLANENRGVEWDTIEPKARQRWEDRNPGTWDKFKTAARYGWDRARDKVS